jgi:hypothetical protein
VSHPHPELGTPPALPSGTLRIVGLGGLGEIGRNMTVFEYQGRLLIVDCGVLFPEPDQPGVDLILPDFTSLDGRLDDIEAMVLTHAHEDHIGAVPYLLRRRDNIPLIGSRLTLALVRSKLTEHRITPAGVEVAEGGRQSFGPFDLEFFAVNHSIPDALAVAITTPAGVVLHTGDFKMDQLPLDGRLTDLGGFARRGAEGVDLLMSDSTNAEVPGIVTSRSSTRSSRARSSGSSWPASPAMCTGSSRCSTRPPRTAAGWRSSAGPWCGTWAWRAISAICGSPRSAAACWWTRATPRACRPARSYWSAPDRRASPCRHCPGWPPGTTRSGSPRATRSSWPPR